MAREITDFGNYIAPSGAYPFGDIKDDSGTGDGTPVSRLTASDIWQFFQKIADQAGVSLNGLADNVTNGFQFVQAMNSVINSQASVLAEACGASGFVPVSVNGMVQGDEGGTVALTMTEGWFFYNSTLYYFPAGTLPTLSFGNAAYISLVNDNGFNYGELVELVNTTPTDASNVSTDLFLENHFVMPTIHRTVGLSWLTGIGNEITITMDKPGVTQLAYTVTSGTGVTAYVTVDCTDAVVGSKLRLLISSSVATAVSITIGGADGHTLYGDNLMSGYKVIDFEYVGSDGTNNILLMGYSST